MRSDYQQTQIGIIPKDWQVSKIGDYAFVTKLAGFEYTLYFDYRKSGPIIAIRALNIKGGTLNLDDVHTIPLETSKKLPRSKLFKGDLVMSYVGTLGRVAVIPEDNKFHLAPNVAKLSVNRTYLLPEYLSHFLNGFQGQKNIIDASASTTQAALSMHNLRKIFFPLPSIAEQEAIAEALSDADALIEALEQLIAKKRLIKQGVMQELLTGKRRLPGLSGKWELKKFSDLFNFSGGVSASRDQLSTDGYCYLHYGDIHMSSKTYIDVESEFQSLPKLNISFKKIPPYALLEDGDVVFVDASEDDEGTSRHVVIKNKAQTPYISGLHTIVAKRKTNELDPIYLQHCFQTRAIKEQFHFYAVGTKVSGISKGNIGKLMMPVPVLSEQTAIATVLNDMDSEITALEVKLTKLRQIKQGMMQELLTGRVRLI